MGNALNTPPIAPATPGVSSFGPAEDRRRYLLILAAEGHRLRQRVEAIAQATAEVINQQTLTTGSLLAGNPARAAEHADALRLAMWHLKDVTSALTLGATRYRDAGLQEDASHCLDLDVSLMIQERLEEFETAPTEAFVRGGK